MAQAVSASAVCCGSALRKMVLERVKNAKRETRPDRRTESIDWREAITSPTSGLNFNLMVRQKRAPISQNVRNFILATGATNDVLEA
jgi:hypothetical protein